MKNYDKARKIQFEGSKHIVTGWEVAGYINSRGVLIQAIAKKDGEDFSGYLLKFNHYEKGDMGKYVYMNQEKYDSIVDDYDPCDSLNTWTMPFLNYIDR